MSFLYEMSEGDLNELLEACKPTGPVIFASGGMPLCPTSQENANYAWQTLGRKMGFKWDTVKPSDKGQRFFYAEPEWIKERDK